MIPALTGLTPAPAQTWGSVRLVPLLRDRPIDDVRMALRSYSEDQLLAIAPVGRGSTYLSYIPHGLVMQWTNDGQPLAAVDTRLGAKESRQKGPIVALNRMARGLGRNALRLLPLHTAMEGYLALHFGGPDTAQRYWSQEARRVGLSPRGERSTPGSGVPGLAEAMRVFERYADQCGVLVFIGDVLASALIVGHPEDYAALHDALLTDFYGPLFAQWGWSFRDVPPFDVRLEGTDIEGIRASLHRAREDLGHFTTEMASGLFGRDGTTQVVRTAGRCKLIQFQTGFDIDRVNLDGEHIGEALVDVSGAPIYLKSYRLDRSQVRRGFVLSELNRVQWDPQRLADEQGHGELARVIGDLDAAGLGWMIRNDWRH